MFIHCAGFVEVIGRKRALLNRWGQNEVTIETSGVKLFDGQRRNELIQEISGLSTILVFRGIRRVEFEHFELWARLGYPFQFLGKRNAKLFDVDSDVGDISGKISSDKVDR